MFRIRRFRASDTKEVTRVITSGLKQLFNCRKIDLGEELIDDLSDIHRNYIARGGAFYVGEYDGRVIGTVAVLPAGRNAARLKRMYLYRTYRRRGFGSRLYDAAESWCKR